jgi:hypothetical protein
MKRILLVGLIVAGLPIAMEPKVLCLSRIAGMFARI